MDSKITIRSYFLYNTYYFESSIKIQPKLRQKNLIKIVNEGICSNLLKIISREFSFLTIFFFFLSLFSLLLLKQFLTNRNLIRVVIWIFDWYWGNSHEIGIFPCLETLELKSIFFRIFLMKMGQVCVPKTMFIVWPNSPVMGDGIGRFENFIYDYQQHGICHRRGVNTSIALKCPNYDRRKKPQRWQNCNISTSWSFWNFFSAILIVSAL